MPFHYKLNYLQNSENLGQISFFIGEIFEEIKVVRFFLDKLYLKFLSISYSEIECLHPDVFQNLTALTLLGLYFSKLAQLHPNHFKNLAKLTQLFLYANSIKDLDQNILKEETELQPLNET
jgi:Leucine-rich repeat (LRR) protein